VDLSLADLRAFVSAVDQGSVGRAALTLGVTQSALSKRLKSLETITGRPLLHRSVSGVRLTAAGELVILDARRALEQVDALHARMASLGAGVPTVRVAATPALAERVVPAAIALLDVGGGGLPVELLVANSSIVRQALAGGRADIGIIAADFDEDLSAHGKPLLDDELVAVVPPGDPWCELEQIPAAEFAARRLIVRDPASHARRTLDHGLQVAGLQLARPLLEVGNPAAVKAAIHGRGVPGVLSRHAVDPVVDGLELRSVEGVDLRRRFWALVDAEASPEAQRVAELLLGDHA